MDARGSHRVDAVVIGRNEGARLVACLAALEGQVRGVVYVDSGSVDGSVQAAREAGARVVELAPDQPFTAARARNAGIATLDAPEFVQVIDGDCALREGWIDAALAQMDAHPRTAVVCGRRRERHVDASIYNALIDAEWNTAPGAALACGGDALIRMSALSEVGLYRDDLIAGEEPELCLRLRRAGWQIWRIDAEMTWHDADMHRFGQWWRRAMRAGHAFAEGHARFSTKQSPHWPREVWRIRFWGWGLPVAGLGLAMIHPAGLALWLAYPLQMLRLWPRIGATGAVFTVLGKLPEGLGALRYHLGRKGLIEYR
jgi:glycosyltransferase involved in cell wall biosynthesis